MEDSEQSQEAICRICFEGSSGGLFISPCKCAGTQKHIHVNCLRAWQENVQKLNVGDERAFRCSVCRSLFTLPPPKPKATARLLQALRGVGGALCITLLAFGLSGPPWPHIALLVLLLLGTRSHSLLALALLLVASVLALMHSKGLHVVMRVDGAGRLGLSVVRRGAPVPGLGPGTLLVASEGLEHTMFRQSVVLVYEHGQEGSKGVMLTQALAHPPGGTWPNRGRHTGVDAGDWMGGEEWPGGLNLAGLHGAIAIRHFFGGPVGMPGEGVHQEMVLLHSVRGVAGTTQVPLAPPPARPPPAPPGASASPSPAPAAPAGAGAEAGAGVASNRGGNGVGAAGEGAAAGGLGAAGQQQQEVEEEEEEDRPSLPFQPASHKRASVGSFAASGSQTAGSSTAAITSQSRETEEGKEQEEYGEGEGQGEGGSWEGGEGSSAPTAGSSSVVASSSSSSSSAAASSIGGSGAGIGGGGVGGGGGSRRAMVEKVAGGWQVAAHQQRRRQLCSSGGGLPGDSMVTQAQAQELAWAQMQARQGTPREGERQRGASAGEGKEGDEESDCAPAAASAPRAGGVGSVADALWPAAVAERLFVGGTLAEVLERATVQPPVALGGFQVVHVFHGLCTWGQAQLEGEIRSGAWAIAKATLGDIMPVPPAQLWESLMASDRLARPQQ